MPHREPIDVLIERSSLGAPVVRDLAGRAPKDRVATIVRTTRSTKAWAPRDLPTPPALREIKRAETLRQVAMKGGEQMPRNRRTSAKAASAASKVLKDGRTGKSSRTAAGSALSQRAPKRRK